MKIITGKTGKPHVTSADDRALHRAEWDGDGFLSVSQPPVLVNSTTLRVYPCDIMFQGCHARVTGTYEDLTFPSGETGKKRIDMLVARYTLSEEGLEDMSLLILTGQSVESSQEPQLPVHETGIIANNVSVADMPLYKIVHDGINASGPVAIASTFPPLSNKYTKEESDLTTKNINQAISKAEKQRQRLLQRHSLLQIPQHHRLRKLQVGLRKRRKQQIPQCRKRIRRRTRQILQKQMLLMRKAMRKKLQQKALLYLI